MSRAGTIGFDPREVENVVDDAEEMAAARRDIGGVADIAAVTERPEELRLHQLGEADHRIERRPQLMAHVGEELRLGAARLLGRLARGEQLGLDLLALGDVEGDGEDGVDPALAVMQRDLAAERAAHRAVGLRQGLLEIEDRLAGLQHAMVAALQIFDEGLAGVLRNAADREILLALADRRRRRAAELLGLRHVDEHVAQLVVLDADSRGQGVDHRLQLAAALGDRDLLPPPLGDIGADAAIAGELAAGRKDRPAADLDMAQTRGAAYRINEVLERLSRLVQGAQLGDAVGRLRRRHFRDRPAAPADIGLERQAQHVPRRLR